MISTAVHFLLDNGIGQNITAGVMVGAVVRTWAEFKVIRPLRRHRETTEAIHAHLLAPGPPRPVVDDDAEIVP